MTADNLKAWTSPAVIDRRYSSESQIEAFMCKAGQTLISVVKLRLT